MCVQPSGSYLVSAGVMIRGSSANFAAIVGLPRVSFLIVRSSALSLANRKLLADLCRASLVFSRSLIASSMRLQGRRRGLAPLYVPPPRRLSDAGAQHQGDAIGYYQSGPRI